MQRATAHYLSREMAILGVVDFALCFILIDTMLQAAGVSVSLPPLADMLPRSDLALAGILTLIVGGIALPAGLYRPEVCRRCQPLLIGIGAAALVAFGVVSLLRDGPDGLIADVRSLYGAEVLTAWLAAMALIRLLHGRLAGRTAATRRVLLFGAPRQVGAVTTRLRSPRGRRFDAVLLPNQAMTWETLRHQQLWAIVMASEPTAQAAEALLDCKFRGIRVLSGAAFQERYLRRIDLEALTAHDLLVSRGITASRISATVKRLCDLIIGAAMLVLLLPLMAVTAVAVKLDSPGPVLYRQVRTGRYDRTYTLYKFRSMTQDAEASGDPRWAQKQDPRVTRVGRFIRATRIDELPQLVNVMRGNMSLVGPRPERPHFVEQLARAIPFYRQRAYVKPGLTGWAQVNFPYGASVEDAREKLAYDLYYVKNRSFALDLRILVSTVRVVLFREGAR